MHRALILFWIKIICCSHLINLKFDTKCNSLYQIVYNTKCNIVKYRLYDIRANFVYFFLLMFFIIHCRNNFKYKPLQILILRISKIQLYYTILKIITHTHIYIYIYIDCIIFYTFFICIQY